MRSHATWRLEVELQEPFGELEVRALGKKLRFGRDDDVKQIGPRMGGPEFAQLGLASLGLGALAWTVLQGPPTPAVGILVAAGAIASWAILLYFLVRPRQVGLMSGWVGRGSGRRAARYGRSRTRVE